MNDMCDLRTLSILGGSMGGGEVLLIMVVALLLFGSKNLPKIARSLGKSMEEFRKAAREVSHEIMHADVDEPPKSKPKPLLPTNVSDEDKPS